MLSVLQQLYPTAEIKRLFEQPAPLLAAVSLDYAAFQIRKLRTGYTGSVYDGQQMSPVARAYWLRFSEVNHA